MYRCRATRAMLADGLTTKDDHEVIGLRGDVRHAAAIGAARA